MKLILPLLLLVHSHLNIDCKPPVGNTLQKQLIDLYNAGPKLSYNGWHIFLRENTYYWWKATYENQDIPAFNEIDTIHTMVNNAEAENYFLRFEYCYEHRGRYIGTSRVFNRPCDDDKFNYFYMRQLASEKNKVKLMLAMARPVLYAQTLDYILCDLEQDSFINVSDNFADLKLGRFIRGKSASQGQQCNPRDCLYGFPVFAIETSNPPPNTELVKRDDVYSLGIIYMTIVLNKQNVIQAYNKDRGSGKTNKDQENGTLRGLLSSLKKNVAKYFELPSYKFAYGKLLDLLHKMISLHVDNRPSLESVVRELGAIHAFFAFGENIKAANPYPEGEEDEKVIKAWLTKKPTQGYSGFAERLY